MLYDLQQNFKVYRISSICYCNLGKVNNNIVSKIMYYRKNNATFFRLQLINNKLLEDEEWLF